MYAISLYIKGDVTKYQEVVVSFCDNYYTNQNGTNSDNIIMVFSNRNSSVNIETNDLEEK